MGNNFASFCSCLSNSSDKGEVSTEDRTTAASQMSDPRGLNAKEIKSKLDKGLEQFLDLLSEGLECPEDSILVDSNSCLVTGRRSSQGCILKYQWTLPVKPSVFVDYILDQDRRKEYDSNLESIELIGTFPKGIQVYLAEYKKFLAVTPRELLTASTVKKLPKGIAVFSVSVDSSEIPVREGCVRVDLKVGGYLVEQIPTGSKITCMSKIDLKIEPSLEHIVRNFSATYIPRIINTISKYITDL